MTLHDPLTERIIGCAYRVTNELGHGFLEKVYENALAHELRKANLKVVQQQGIEVHYDGIVVGEFVADLLLEGRIIVELKAARAIEEVHVAQCLNYLKATGLETCLLINFGKARIEVRRFSSSRDRFMEDGQNSDGIEWKFGCSVEQRTDSATDAGDAGDEGDERGND